ncbi:MAG: TadE family protein [Tardiphaga sp.]|nr:TadE family protein [Tardiphaga sp.]MDB5548504.1 TadE family protein [Tardiphaga sp.]MDB5626328.1 TadE family protein [Tardiphaga sp.]MDB5630299.1 TadE family protein [Tardiphaga sp.]
MPSPLLSTSPIALAFRHFRRNRGGSAAVEFAFVAPIFFALIFAVFETALMFFAGQVLENAVQDSGRMVYVWTGKSPLPQSTFTTDFCPRVQLLFNCANVSIDMQSYPPGTPIPTVAPYDGSGNQTTPMSWNPGSPGSGNTVVLRVFYKWPLVVTGLGYNIANINRGSINSQRLLTASAGFRIEPPP